MHKRTKTDIVDGIFEGMQDYSLESYLEEKGIIISDNQIIPRWVTAKQAEEILGYISRPTLNAIRDRGDITCKKIVGGPKSKRIAYDLQSLIDYMRGLPNHKGGV